jgi:hypothetical protein
MFEAPPGSAARRPLLDAGYTVGLLAVAVLCGYGLLAPERLVGAVAGRPAPVALVTPSPQAPVPAPAMPAPAVEPAAPPPEAPMPTETATMPAGPEAAPAKPEVALAKPEAPAPAPPRRLEPARPAEPDVRPAPSAVRPERPRGAWSGTVTGRVVDSEGRPVTGASVVVAGVETPVGEDGTFTLTPPPDATLLVKRPGYWKVSVEPARSPVEVVLQPKVIKAAYLTYFGFGDRGIRGRVLDLVARTELNAVVIDVKGDRGWILYPTRVGAALEAGAQGPATVRDFDGMMADLKARGVYTIARIVTFKDNVLATHRPDLAVIDTRTGKPWVDREGLAWVDPFREEVWDYNLAIAKEAVERGFDEIQFDYVRFPTDGKLAAARYAKPVSKETRLPAITAFLERARRELGAQGAYVAADVFGYTAFNENDTDIGQRIEELAPHLDYICPMVYPSGYHMGIPGYRNPIQNSYTVVRESVRLIRKRAAGTAARVRPWLQDFRDYAFDKRVFGVLEIRNQIRGADEAGGTGWMLWNPRNDYTGAALRAKSPLAAQ